MGSSGRVRVLGSWSHAGPLRVQRAVTCRYMAVTCSHMQSHARDKGRMFRAPPPTHTHHPYSIRVRM